MKWQAQELHKEEALHLVNLIEHGDGEDGHVS